MPCVITPALVPELLELRGALNSLDDPEGDIAVWDAKRATAASHPSGRVLAEAVTSTVTRSRNQLSGNQRAARVTDVKVGIPRRGRDDIERCADSVGPGVGEMSDPI